MNPLFERRARRLIPRWRDTTTTATLGELRPLRTSDRSFPDAALGEKAHLWIEAPSLFVAADLIGTAVMCSSADDRVIEAAQFVLDSDPSASIVAKRVANRTLQQDTATFEPPVITRAELYQRIHVAKGLVNRDPRDSLARADLSYLYTLAGQIPKAINMMEIALALSPNNRYILRSAARLFVHNRDAEKALWTLRNSDRTPSDPWLMAAEISVAGMMSHSSQLVKPGLSVVSSGRFHPHDLTEVASALGTVEAEHGSRRKAKRLFEVSLIDPNDNVLAQAAWAARETQAVAINPQHIRVPLSYEARARLGFQNKDFQNAFRESIGWFNDQRFSVRAAAFSSYIAAVVLQQHEAAISLLKEALVANPDDWTLRNNLAFSLASVDRMPEATDIFARLSDDNSDTARHGVWLATSGLMAFRRGEHAEGQRLYDQAIREFDSNNLTAARAVAAVFKAREELHAKLPTASVAVDNATKLVKEASSPELDLLLGQLHDANPEQLSLNAD